MPRVQPQSASISGSSLVGKKAPAVRLQDQSGETVALADFLGRWVVLYFYPKDDTPGCTAEGCDFSAGLKSFEKLNATVLGCSPDSVESHRKFAAKYKLKIALLSDPTKKTLIRYGAYGEKLMYGKKVIGVIRSTVIVDPRGRIAHHWPRAKAAGHAVLVKRTLEQLQTGE